MAQALGPMFSIFNRQKDRAFSIVSVGDNWVTRPLMHDGVAGTLQVRQLPSSLDKRPFKYVALAQLDHELSLEDLRDWNGKIQAALERGGSCLLVLVHQAGAQPTWYAYAATRKALDGAFVSLRNPAVRWGINEDPNWEEYDHARNLVGA